MSLNSYNCDLSFLTQYLGWMNCSGKLSSILDGGASWTDVTPRVRNGVLTTDPAALVPTSKPIKTHQLKLADPKTGTPAAIHSQTASTPHPPTQIAKMPVVALPIRDFKLLTSGAGWVSTGSQLLFTTDNGAHWKDISPPNPNGDSLSGVFFLDANTGWLLYATATDDTTPDGQPIDYYTHIFATTDGGSSWTMVSQLPILSLTGEVTGGGSLVFSDKLHGWVELGTIRSGVLFSTSDGGRTWQSPRANLELVQTWLPLQTKIYG